MTATDLSKLADLIEEDSLPRWFREQVDDRPQEIVDALERGGSIILRGPQGQEVSIASETQVKSSA